MADVFTVALIKGAVEMDVFKYFGSLHGVDRHVAVAEAAGLLVSAGGLVATGEAHRIYLECGLANLPDGRAYLVWLDRPEVAAALTALGEGLE